MSEGTAATSVPAPRDRHRATHIALWVLQVFTAAVVLFAGISAITGAAQAMVIFDAIGAGDWFRYLTGILEIAGALGLLIPRLAGLAGLALAALWLGAIATHLFLIGQSPVPAVFFFVLSAGIAWGRWGQIRDLLPGW